MLRMKEHGSGELKASAQKRKKAMNELFEDWEDEIFWHSKNYPELSPKKDERPVFVRDGIVNYEEWHKESSRKILFVLLESYRWQESFIWEKVQSIKGSLNKKIQTKLGIEEGAAQRYIDCFKPDKRNKQFVSVDLARLVNAFSANWKIDRDNPCEVNDKKKVEGIGWSPTWYRLAEWIRYSEKQEQNDDQLFEMFHSGQGAEDSLGEVQEQLRKSAFINLKKSSGSSTSKKNEIRRELKTGNNIEKIIREIEIINPGIIVCCGNVTGDLFGEVIRGQIGDWINEKEVVKVPHPGARRMSAEAKFEKFCNAIPSIV